MNLSQLPTRDLFAIGVLFIIVIIIIAIKVFKYFQESNFQNDMNTLELNDFVDKYKHEIPEVELTLLWHRVQSDQESEEATPN